MVLKETDCIISHLDQNSSENERERGINNWKHKSQVCYMQTGLHDPPNHKFLDWYMWKKLNHDQYILLF